MFVSTLKFDSSGDALHAQGTISYNFRAMNYTFYTYYFFKLVDYTGILVRWSIVFQLLK